MSACNKLNSASCNGSLGIAAVREVLAQSGPAFFLTWVALLAGNLVCGDMLTPGTNSFGIAAHSPREGAAAFLIRNREE
jgi:hypothetical protein